MIYRHFTTLFFIFLFFNYCTCVYVLCIYVYMYVYFYKTASTNRHKNQDLWITVTLDDTHVPVPLTINCNGQQEPIHSYEIIFYDQPNPKRLQFLSHDPLELDISTKELSGARSEGSASSGSDQHSAMTASLQKILAYSHRLTGQSTKISDDLIPVLTQINASYYLENDIQTSCNKTKNQHRVYRILMWIKTIIAALVYKSIHLLTSGMLSIMGCGANELVLVPFLLLFLTEATLYALNLRLPKGLLNTVALKDLSVAGQQVDLRLQQLHFWPHQYMMIRDESNANTAEKRAYYISFYNSMWLVANDIIIGLAIGSFLRSNHHVVASLLHQVLNKYTVESLQSMMLWFLESPAGLKLNHELGSFLSELFLWLIRLWTECMQIIEPHTPQIVYIIGVSGVFGVSMIISLSSDVLAFMTLHVYCFYMVAARIFNWQLLILYSLFNLFRGKKRNLLRNRIDSCDYDLDQLLLGTCLFTLLTFIFPTVIIYYLTFALGRMGVIFLQAIMETLLAFFNHFPLFAIMLRIKDPERLPGGLQFSVFDNTRLLKKSQPLYSILKRYTHYCQKAWRSMRISRPRTDPSTRDFRSSHHPLSFAPKPPNRTLSFLKSNTTLLQNRLENHRGTYLRMRNMPIPFGAIFFQYMLLWKRLSAHYFSAYVFKCLLYGEPIKPIPKLQYPMLPDRR
ncbi:N-acetylglucosaminyl transferase component-domain-containing protein [Spinellus fusiger]|nr:N-acetylglucosaminyl transferase component-domain-containing protein [Spinellus fusiger]KAI7862005.1 N-acetylglucosaminyl transferase component-domain-containing protein [Spinellus fusiger]